MPISLVRRATVYATSPYSPIAASRRRDEPRRHDGRIQLDASVPIEAAQYDWAAAYATADTATLLQLIPQIRLGVSRAIMNPYE
jgi:hypothetical protein